MIQVITLLRRRADLSHAEFMTHWRQVHGPLIASLESSDRIRRYEQLEVIADPAAGDGYDGVAIQWFDSVDEFRAQLQAPDQGPHRDDVGRFLDVGALRMAIVGEPVVVLDERRRTRPLGAAPLGGADAPEWELWEAHRQITDLVHAYADLIDAADLDGLAELFGDAVVAFEVAPGDERETTGGRAFADGLAATNIPYPNGTFATKHVVTNLRIDVAADRTAALATSYVTVLQATPSLPLQPIYAGRYRDRFRRDGSTWRYERRTMIADLIGDLTHHVVSGTVPT